jgi:hypothetical protein
LQVYVTFYTSWVIFYLSIYHWVDN